HARLPEVGACAVNDVGRDAVDAGLACVVGVDALDHAAHERRYTGEALVGIVGPGDAGVAGERLRIGERIATGRECTADQFHGLFGYGAAADLNAEAGDELGLHGVREHGDRKSTRLNSSHVKISYAVFC